MSASTIYSQRTTTTLTLSNSYQTILSNIPRGKYLLSFSIDPGTLHLAELLFSDTNSGIVYSFVNCDCSDNEFPSGTCDLICMPGNDYYDINLQYVSGTLSVLLVNGGSTPANPVSFDLLYIGTDSPTVSSNISVDILTSSNNSNPITVNNDLQTTGRLRKTTTITSSTTLNNGYDIVLCNPSTAITITLPQASVNNGREYSIVNKTANIITINTHSGDTIDNGSTTSITLLTQYSKIKLTSDGTTIWFSSI
jgi:hypothetical protein